MRVRLVVLKVEPAQVAGPLHPVLHWRDWGATYGRKLTDLYVNDLKETKRETPLWFL